MHNGNTVTLIQHLLQPFFATLQFFFLAQLARNSTFTILSANASVVGGTNSTCTPLAAPPAGMTLYWRVRANGMPNGPGGYSNYRTFCINPGCP